MVRQALMLCLLLASSLAGAQASVFGPAGLDFSSGAQLAALSPDERQRLREQIRDQWQNKSPAEREQMKEEFRRQRQAPEQQRGQNGDARPPLQRMPAEDRRAFREELRQQRNQGGGERPQRPRR